MENGGVDAKIKYKMYINFRIFFETFSIMNNLWQNNYRRKTWLMPATESSNNESNVYFGNSLNFNLKSPLMLLLFRLNLSVDVCLLMFHPKIIIHLFRIHFSVKAILTHSIPPPLPQFLFLS